MLRFQIAPFSVSYHSGTLTINRPAPPAPPKAPTLDDLFAERRRLNHDLATAASGNSMIVGRSFKAIGGEIAAVDAKIEMFTTKAK